MLTKTHPTASGDRRAPPARPPQPQARPPQPEQRGRSEEMPTVTWSQPQRRRRFTESLARTIDFPGPGSMRTLLLRGLLFLGAFITGVIIAIAAYEIFAGPSQPEATPPGAPTSPARRPK